MVQKTFNISNIFNIPAVFLFNIEKWLLTFLTCLQFELFLPEKARDCRNVKSWASESQGRSLSPHLTFSLPLSLSICVPLFSVC